MTVRIAHLADVHLGYRAHNVMAPGGLNQRAVDVALAFRAAVDAILAARPDAAVIAGDFFHEPKPSNHDILFAFAELKRLRHAGIQVVLVAGNHDTPRRSETGCILRLFEQCGIDVAQDDVQQFVYPGLDLRIVAVPHVAVMEGAIPPAEGTERYQVLLAHAEVQGVYRKRGDRASGQIPAEVLDRPWSAVMLGDYHIAHEVAPRVWYPGSLEFTSSNPWSEIGTPKGWLLWDLDAGTVELQAVPQARPVYDLEPIEATGLDPQQMNALIAERLACQDITGALVRLIVLNIPQPIRQQLDHAAIKEAKTRALHFNLDLRAPDRLVTTGPAMAANRGKPLADLFSDFLRGFELTPGINREVLIKLGMDLMAETDAALAEPSEKRGAA